MFQLRSPAFEDGQRIPTKYCNTRVSGGENLSLPLSWEGAPAETKSFCLAMVDRHPIANNWVHWLVINIPATVTNLTEGASKTKSMPATAQELVNTFGFQGYGGPQPPPGTGDHNYETTVFALDVESTNLGQRVSLDEFSVVVQSKTLESAQLTGTYSR